jgi:hypothetical protein
LAHLPLSAAAQIVHHQALPVETEQCKSFLAGCGITEDVWECKPWIDAWCKVLLTEANPQISKGPGMDGEIHLPTDVVDHVVRHAVDEIGQRGRRCAQAQTVAADPAAVADRLERRRCGRAG